MHAPRKKMVGFEAELGAHAIGGGAGDDAAFAAASLLADAHAEVYGHVDPSRYGCRRGLREFGGHLFRIYLDHAHIELSSPLTSSASELVRWQARATALVQGLREHACGKNDTRIRVHAANTNRAGAAWAFHVNVLLQRETYDSWRDQDWRPLLGQWIPFSVTSPILFGTGKVGSENGQRSSVYQLSQRADFIDRIVGLETVASKSLINSRDEPLADPRRFARFHITAVFDWNSCPAASFLKFGTTQVLLGLLEAKAPLPDLQLRDPLHALARVSRDTRLCAKLELADGRRLAAIEIQEILAEAAVRSIEKGVISEDTVPQAEEIVPLWKDTLMRLRKKDPILRRRIDWIAKKAALDLWRRRLGIPWSDPTLLALDLKYAELGGGWFEDLQRRGLIDGLEDFLPPEILRDPPSSSPRDRARARILEKFGPAIRAVDWDRLCISVAEGSGPATHELLLDDPLDAEAVLKAIAKAGSPRTLIQELPATVCFPITCSTADQIPIPRPQTEEGGESDEAPQDAPRQA